MAKTRDCYLGDTLRVNLLLAVDGVGVESETPVIYIRRASDDLLYDFDDDTFKAEPTTAFDTLTEDEDLHGLYYYEFDTSILNAEDLLVCYVQNGGTVVPWVEVQEFQIVRKVYEVHGSMIYNYDTGHTHFGAFMTNGMLVVNTPSRVTFRVVSQAGVEVMAAYQVSSGTSGFFTYDKSGMALVAHTTYYLEVTVEYAGYSYFQSFEFNTL
jgi:hypothetical protein